MALTSTIALCYTPCNVFSRLRGKWEVFFEEVFLELCKISGVWVEGLRSFQLLALVVGLSFISLSAFSQSGSSSIQGTLTDKSGGVVQGATVTVT